MCQVIKRTCYDKTILAEKYKKSNKHVKSGYLKSMLLYTKVLSKIHNLLHFHPCHDLPQASLNLC